MLYSETHLRLKMLFSPLEKVIEIPGSAVRIKNVQFVSEDPDEFLRNSDDSCFEENRTFSYPVFVPAERAKRKVILLLHGLNERSWVKYLTWALYLCESTGSYVILFPISFHINRSPDKWKEPRVMDHEVGLRKTQMGVSKSSFMNVALSTRLTEDPRRFFFSGYRTVTDIINLTGSIKGGGHRVIPETNEINIFSYSIGAFLAEIIMLANPSRLFSETKLFMFCGGSFFSKMQGTSKLIMDSVAFDRIFRYYMDEFEQTMPSAKLLADFFNSNRLGMAFRSMIDKSRLFKFREKGFRDMQERIKVIALIKDQVIPAEGIIETFDINQTGKVVDVTDFPFDYSHENPFPIHPDREISRKVDHSFNTIMANAVEFLG